MAEKTKRNVLRTILQFLLAFLLCVSVAGTLLAGIAAGATTERAMTSRIDDVFLEQALTELRESLNNLTTPSGLPDNFFNDPAQFNAESLQKTLTENIGRAYRQQATDVDKNALQDFFKDEFRKYLDAQPAEDAIEATDEGIAYLASTCADTAAPYLDPMLLREMAQILGKIHSLLRIAAIACAVQTAIILLFLLSISPGVLAKLRFTGTSLFAAVLLIVPLPAYLLATHEISRVGISSASLHTFICGYAESLLLKCVLAGAILFAIYVLLWVLDFVLKKRLDFSSEPVV